MDASGTPDLNTTIAKHDPYVVVIACVPDPEALRVGLSIARARCGMKSDFEFHAHEMPEEFSAVALARIIHEAGSEHDAKNRLQVI